MRERPELRREARAVREVELACLRSADVSLAISDAERRMLLDLAPEAVVETLPNIFTSRKVPPPGLAGRRELLFVGGFWQRPNGDAVLWFVERVLPRIRAELPDTVFRIAGSNMTDEVRALADRPGVELFGYAEDLTPVLDTAHVFVAPLRYGAGMKGKVGHAMISGLPVVATTIGGEGMSASDGVHLLMADEPEDFADHVVSLLRDDALWHRLQAEGQALIEATLSAAAIAERVRWLFRV